MCKCLAGNVTCCCLSCALSVLLSILSAFLVVFIVAGVLIYYFYYYEEEDDVTKIKNDVHDGFKNALDKVKDALNRK